MSSIVFGILFICLVGAALSANEPNCGTKSPNWPDPARIIGGEETKPHEFPWQCSLQNIGGHFCGASILNKRWILTAGHCAPSSPDSFQVLCGAHNLSQLEGTEVRAKVNQIIVHRDYDSFTLANDVALFKLTQDLPLDDPKAHLGSICIPDAEPLDRFAGKSCIATGWGQTDSSGVSDHSVLKKVSLKVWKHDDCKKQWEPFVTDKQICFGGGNESICMGDSGGPLNCFNKAEGRWYSYGISSFVETDDCIGPNGDVDTRVSAYSKWIWDMIEHN